MTDDKDVKTARNLLSMIDQFPKIDVDIQDKLLNGVKCLAFLYSMADTKNDTNTTFEKTITAIEA